MHDVQDRQDPKMISSLFQKNFVVEMILVQTNEKTIKKRASLPCNDKDNK